MSEWQIERNQWGGVRRFRIDAYGHKEYEMTIDGIPESQYQDTMKRQAEERAMQLEMENRKPPAAICPVKQMRDAASAICTDDCIMHTADGCGLVTDAAPTGGARCPLTRYKCHERCAWNGETGCKLRLKGV